VTRARRPGRACARHRSVLLDLVERRPEPGPATDAALAHLDRCRACEDELAALTLTSLALRRLWAEARTARPPDRAWPAVRDRLGRPSGPSWQSRLPIAGLAVAAALVALVLGPSLAWTGTGGVFEEPGTDPVLIVRQAREGRTADRLAEVRFIMARRAGPPAGPAVDWRAVAPRPDPDRVRDAGAPASVPDPAPPATRLE
jgi:hypothetical protein